MWPVLDLQMLLVWQLHLMWDVSGVLLFVLECHFNVMCCSLCLLSLFSLVSQQHFCPATGRRKTKMPPIWQCPWPCVFFLCHSTHPISKTAGCLINPTVTLPLLYSVPRCTVWTWPAKSWCSLVRLPLDYQGLYVTLVTLLI